MAIASGTARTRFTQLALFSRRYVSFAGKGAALVVAADATVVMVQARARTVVVAARGRAVSVQARPRTVTVRDRS